MSWMARKVANAAIEQVAGSGVEIDAEGHLTFPDGLDPPRIHRFIELVMDARFDSPKAALHSLFRRVGVTDSAVEALDEILDDDGGIVWREVGRHPVHLTRALPHLREIPACFRSFLIDGLGFAAPGDETLEAAVVSTRQNAAAALGCAPTWDAILGAGDRVADLARPWRDRTASR